LAPKPAPDNDTDYINAGFVDVSFNQIIDFVFRVLSATTVNSYAHKAHYHTRSDMCGG